ncbi:ABC transporter permease [soil metagenome]
MNTLLHDLRYAARRLLKSPGFTLIAVLTLALGIGINTTVFSVVNAVLIRPMPQVNTDGLVILRDVQRAQGEEGGASYPDLVDWKAGSTTLADVAAYRDRDVVVMRPGGDAEEIPAEVVTPNLFPMLGAHPARGRLFLPEEGTPGKNRAVILSHKLWSERFDADPEVVGSNVTVDGQPHDIVGVMPPRFGFPNNQLLWVPFAPAAASEARGDRYLRAIGRLEPGATATAAQQELSALASRLAEQYPESNAGHGVRVGDFDEVQTGGMRPVLLVMLGAVALVLLIACGNVANLFLARAAGRQREIAVRVALGATRWRVIRQLLTESIVVALLGGLAGVGVAYAGLRLILSAFPFDLPLWIVFDIDPNVLLFTLALSVGTGIVFGLAPALRVGRPDRIESLRDGGRGPSGSAAQGRMRGALAVGELALATVLLIGAMLMVRSLLRLQGVEPGFDTAQVLTARVTAAGARDDDEGARQRFFQQLVEGAGTLGGATGAAVVTRVPLAGGSSSSDFEVEGRPPSPGQQPSAEYRGIAADYFEAIGMPLERGRSVTPTEVAAAAPVVVVNRTLADRFWPGEDPIGLRLRIGESWRTVVGIVPDVRLRSLDERPMPQLYAPFTAGAPRSLTLLVRTGSASATAPALRDLVRAADPGVPLEEIVGMDEVLRRSLWRQRLFGGMFTAFAGIALLLAVTGVYGVLAYAVSLRTHEIGVRMALGAGVGRVLRLVVGRGAVLAAMGLALGVAGAFALTRVLSSLLYGVSATDPLAFVGSIAVLGGAALLACYVPARRAARLDPMIALRAE